MYLLALGALIPAVFITALVMSKKTSRAVRTASIAALVLIGTAFAVCAVILFLFMFRSSDQTVNGLVEIPVPPPRENNMRDALVMAALALILIIMVIVLSIREQRRLHKKQFARSAVARRNVASSNAAPSRR